jgi:hypothetical protein
MTFAAYAITQAKIDGGEVCNFVITAIMHIDKSRRAEQTRSTSTLRGKMLVVRMGSQLVY